MYTILQTTIAGVMRGRFKLTETVIERIQGESYCLVYTGERKFINQLNKLSKSYPEVDIRHINDDGSIVAHVPFSWFRFVKPLSKRNISDEQRRAASERMKKMKNSNEITKE